MPGCTHGDSERNSVKPCQTVGVNRVNKHVVNFLLCLQGVQLDDCTSSAHRCECSDTVPVCPRCGGARQSRDPVGVASLGVASVGVTTAGTQRHHVTTPTSPGGRDVFETPPTAAAVPDDDNVDDDDNDEFLCFQRLHSTSEITVTQYQCHHQQQRSFSTGTESFSVLPDPRTDVGGVSVRSAPDSAVPFRQPEVVQGHVGQRSKLQRFFEPLKRSKSTGNHKDAIAAAQASLYDPSRQQIPVDYC